MSNRFLQVNYKFSLNPEELAATAIQRAESIAAEVAGLNWKIFLLNEAEHELGGLYSFVDEESLNNYINSPLFTGLKSNPNISDISIKKFAVLENATSITRGPV